METEKELIAACLKLVPDHSVLSVSERNLAGESMASTVGRSALKAMREAILLGADPLGEAFTRIHSAIDRRDMGAVYTPIPIVRSMMNWLAEQGPLARIVDPGAGSGRFILCAAERFTKAELVAVEMNPLAALMLRANLSVRGFAERSTVHVLDYREMKLGPVEGVTAFIGNPPYVRHHRINEDWKNWYSKGFEQLGIKASALAGLHLHFFLQTRLLANTGDVGAFITSSEWLDVNYGAALRRLLLEGLGGLALHVLEPAVEAFPGTATTATITCFRIGECHEPVRVRSVSDLERLNSLRDGISVPRARLKGERRWSEILRPSESDPERTIELGELFRVHRGQVTGANQIWIAGDHSAALPDRIKQISVTKAKDLIQAGARLQSDALLRRVIDLPHELDEFSSEERQRIGKFLSWARVQGADQGYIARHRKAWWSVGLKEPAPILCTYMARRPPQFTLNTIRARHINIAHGLYPRDPLPPDALASLVAWLNANIKTGSGRTYAGGLTKFEPKEIERLRIPRLETFTS